MQIFITCILLTYLKLDVGATVDEYAHCTDQRLCGDDLNPNPICGHDGRGKYQKFDNECEMEKENCRIQVKKGYVYMLLPEQACPKSPAKRAILEDNPIKPKEIDESHYAHCKKACPENGTPICGYNGHAKYQVFSSECAMDIENCRVQVRKEPVYMSLLMHMCDKFAKN